MDLYYYLLETGDAGPSQHSTPKPGARCLSNDSPGRGQRLLLLVPFLLLVTLVAATGMNFLPGAWYAQLNKPGWTPPNWLFPLVWTLLYVLIAISGWRLWCRLGPALKGGAASCLMACSCA